MLGKAKLMKGFDYKYQHTADLNDVIIVIRGYNYVGEWLYILFRALLDRLYYILSLSNLCSEAEKICKIHFHYDNL